MKIVYGQRGQPAASIEGDGLFAADGRQIAQIIDGNVFRVDDGSWIGSVAGGVIYNRYGAPQGFTRGCKRGIPASPPKIPNMLPPRLLAQGRDVTGEPHQTPPDFLRNALSSTSGTAFRDGYFA